MLAAVSGPGGQVQLKDTQFKKHVFKVSSADTMSSAFVFDGLRMHLKARGMTYADVAKALKGSEPTVKRIFPTRNCSLDRLDAMCELVEVDLAELARGAPREDRLINRLTREQEDELMADPRLLLVAVCALHQMRVEEIVETYKLDETQCVALLL